MTEPIDVAVIGGGPAGLAAATRLRALGIAKVVVLERDEACGGATRHCGHPSFGLREMRRLLGGGRYAKHLEQAARDAGVDIRTRHTVHAIADDLALDVLSPGGRSRIIPRRIVLATGARETPRSARLVGGDRPLGVVTTGTLQSYIYLEKLLPFRRPVIVGTELVSLSSLLTCRTHGIAPAAVVENASHPIARWPLTLFPTLLGIPIYLGSEIVDIQGDPRVERVVVRDSAGALREIACDGVVFTGRFVPETTLARKTGLALDGATGVLAIDQFGRTSDPRIFAAGNGIRPIETAGWCWAEGRTIATCVATDLSDGLPTPGTGVEIRFGPGIRFVTPTRIWPGYETAGLRHLQLRLDDSFVGRVAVKHKGRTMSSLSLRSGPERRILLAISRIKLPSGADTLDVTLESNASLKPARHPEAAVAASLSKPNKATPQ